MPINVNSRRQGELLSRSCSSSPTEKKSRAAKRVNCAKKTSWTRSTIKRLGRLYPNASGSVLKPKRIRICTISSNLPQYGSRSGSGNQLQIRLRDPAPGSGFSSGFAATMKEKIWHFFFHCFKFFKFFFISFYQLKVDFLLLKYTSQGTINFFEKLGIRINVQSDIFASFLASRLVFRHGF